MEHTCCTFCYQISVFCFGNYSQCFRWGSARSPTFSHRPHRFFYPNNHSVPASSFKDPPQKNRTYSSRYFSHINFQSSFFIRIYWCLFYGGTRCLVTLGVYCWSWKRKGNLGWAHSVFSSFWAWDSYRRRQAIYWSFGKKLAFGLIARTYQYAAIRYAFVHTCGYRWLSPISSFVLFHSSAASAQTIRDDIAIASASFPFARWILHAGCWRSKESDSCQCFFRR